MRDFCGGINQDRVVISIRLFLNWADQFHNKLLCCHVVYLPIFGLFFFFF
jgi:hypothetical protein